MMNDESESKMKMQSLETRVKATTKKLQDKLKHASSLQQKAMKMENKEKVQPDVIHQIISDIRKETMEAVSLNSALKELKGTLKAAVVEVVSSIGSVARVLESVISVEAVNENT